MKDWDLSRQNTVVGGCALGNAVYMGANKLETVRRFGGPLDFRLFRWQRADGRRNEDADLNVVRIILKKLKSSSSSRFTSFVNYRKSTTLKWKVRYVRSKYTSDVEDGVLESLAIHSGNTALNIAVMRDVEIVRSIENGADPYVESDLGMNAFETAKWTLPSVLKALRKHNDK